MYSLRAFAYPYEYYYSPELIIVVSIFAVLIAMLVFYAINRFNILPEVKLFFNRKQRLSIANYTLAFEPVELNDQVPIKKISVVTRVLLIGFCLTFILLPFGDFLPTSEWNSELYFYFPGINWF